MTPEPVIRPYRPSDLDALYEVCLRTGYAGEDASDVVADPRLLGEIYVAPYAVLEPERAFVLDDGTGVPGGYIVGTADTRGFEAACERSWWPKVRARYPEGRETGALDDLLVALVHRPVAADDAVVARYPAHLHIDLLPPWQGRGHGRALMERFLDAVRDAGASGVHLGVSVDNERATGFYRRLGFTEIRADGITRTFGLGLVSQ